MTQSAQVTKQGELQAAKDKGPQNPSTEHALDAADNSVEAQKKGIIPEHVGEKAPEGKSDEEVKADEEAKQEAEKKDAEKQDQAAKEDEEKGEKKGLLTRSGDFVKAQMDKVTGHHEEEKK